MQHLLAEDWLKEKDVSPNMHRKFLPKKSANLAKKPSNSRISASLKRGSVQRDTLGAEALNRTGNRSHKSPRKSTTRNTTEREKSSSYIDSLLEPQGLGEKVLKHLIKRHILRDIVPKDVGSLLKHSNKQYADCPDASKKLRSKNSSEKANNAMKNHEEAPNRSEGAMGYYMFQNKENIAPGRRDNSENGCPKKKKRPSSKNKEPNSNSIKTVNPLDFMEKPPFSEDNQQPPTCRKVKQVSASSLASMFGKIEMSKQLLDLNRKTALDKNCGANKHGAEDAPKKASEDPPRRFLDEAQKKLAEYHQRKIPSDAQKPIPEDHHKKPFDDNARKQAGDAHRKHAEDASKKFVEETVKRPANEPSHSKKPRIRLNLDDEASFCLNSFNIEKKLSGACSSHPNSKKVNLRAQSYAQDGKPSLKIGNSYLDLELLLKKKQTPQGVRAEEEPVEGKLSAENNINIQASKFSRFSRKGYDGFHESDSSRAPALRAFKCKKIRPKNNSAENRNKSCGNIEYFNERSLNHHLNENIQGFATISLVDNINNRTVITSSSSKQRLTPLANQSSPHFYKNHASEILVINDLLDTHHKRKSTPDDRLYTANDYSDSRNKSFKKMGSGKVNLNQVSKNSLGRNPSTSDFNSLDSHREKGNLSRRSGSKIPTLKEMIATTAQPSHCKRKQVTRSGGRTTSNPRTYSRKGDRTIMVNVADFGTDSTKHSLCESSYMDCEENLNLCSSFLHFNRDNSRRNLLEEQQCRKHGVSSNGKFSSQVMSNYKKPSLAHNVDMEDVQNWREEVQENFRGSRNLRYEHKLNESLEESSCSSLSPECDKTKLGSQSHLELNSSNVNFVTLTKFNSSSNKIARNNHSLINIVNNNISDISETPRGEGPGTDIQEFWLQEESLYEEESFSKALDACEKAAFKIDQETYSFLISREPYYTPDPYYLEKKQPFLNWQMRAVLLDWMMEVCTEFGLKRETYHISINILDRYLTSCPPVEKVEFQLIGVTSIYISSKIEEVYPPRLSDFVRSTDNGYSCELIQEMEERIFKVLQWLVNPPTLNLWANWFMLKWDLYVENTNFAKCYLMNMSNEADNKLLQFKKANEQCYRLFRELFLYLDTATLDIQSFQYKSRPLIAAFLFLILGEKCGQFSKEQIGAEFSKNSLFILNPDNVFNSIFSDFIVESFGFSLAELLPTIRYASTFFEMNLFYDLPPIVKKNPENFLQGHFEEFLAYQTYSNVSLNFIQNKKRLDYC